MQTQLYTPLPEHTLVAHAQKLIKPLFGTNWQEQNRYQRIFFFFCSMFWEEKHVWLLAV
jgi:hypothetical protein